MQLAGMETKFAKVLDSGMPRDVDMKRKRIDNAESYLGAAGISVPLRCALRSSPPLLVKRQKLDGQRIKPSSSSNLGKSLQRCYFNFKNSGPPQRIMYSQNGAWTDFSKDVVALVKKGMKMQNAIVEVNVEDDMFLLDFLHMTRVHLRTGVQQPIAWVDEAGICYFPESFSDANIDDCSHNENGSDNGHLVTEHQGSHDFTMKLEIEISGADIFNMKESIGESNAIAAHVRISNNTAGERFDAEDDLSCVRDNVHDVEDFEESKIFVEDVPNNIVRKEEHLNADVVKGLFSKGIGSFVGADIVALDCGSGTLREGRRELFQKQADIVKRLRGDANIRYAWLPCPKGAIYSVMNFGLGSHMSSSIMSCGIGAHLIPVSCTNVSANLFDVDENGVGNVVLCCVIMGKMEYVHPASKQFHPSSNDFDSGVDDCQDPKQYVVWSMNMNTHIYPEYAVCFKISSYSNVGSLYGNGNGMDVSGVTNCSEVIQAQGGSCQQVSTKDTHGKSSSHLMSPSVRLPKSPWMPFPLLLAAISSNVSEKDMQLINHHYKLYQNKMLSRGDFIMKLRLTVGDTLLKSILTSLHSKMPSKFQTGLVAQRPKEEAE